MVDASPSGHPSHHHPSQSPSTTSAIAGSSSAAAANWPYTNSSPAHPALSNVISAYSGTYQPSSSSSHQQQQQQQGHETHQHQQHQQNRIAMDGNHHTHHHHHASSSYDTTISYGSGPYEAPSRDDISNFALQAAAAAQQQHYKQEQHHDAQEGSDGEDGYDGLHPSGGDGLVDGSESPYSAAKRAKLGSGRVAKACQPCSSKKRRCDGGKPECSVCKVLGTPCSYNNTGLKRGPPKGFRSGPKESAKAKLTRILETTVRDLATHLGPEEANREINRVSRERGLIGLGSASNGGDIGATLQAFAAGAATGNDLNNQASGSNPSSAAAAAAIAAVADHGVAEKGVVHSLAAEDDSFLGVNERGDLMHRGSSSGLHLLRRPGGAGTAGGAGSPPSSSDSPGSGDRSVRTANTNATPMVLPIPSPGTSNLRPPRMDQILASPQSQSSSKGSQRISHPSADGLGDPIVTAEESHKLFDNYWRCFHPYWPILYKAILDEIKPHEVASRLDGLLLNAIYAIGSSGQGSDAYEFAHGYSEEEISMRRSGEVFAHAAERRLYATGLRPTVSAIQASFFLSVFNHGNGELSRAWTFCGIAINMAMDLGLHRWPIHRLDLLENSAERETRTRTIWSLYILDKILCAEMGRSPILRVKEMDPPLLSEDVPDETECMDGDPARQMRIASCFNAAVHIFAILEQILSEVHSLRRKAVLRRGESKPEILAELDRELESWAANLPEHLRVPTDRSSPKVGFPGIVWALGVWEATAVILLHRPFIPQGTNDDPPTLEEVMSSSSHQKATAAADRLCRLLHLDADSVREEYDVSLWPSDYAYCLFTAAVMYLFDARIGVPGARQKFARSRDHIKRLASKWPTASAHRQLLDGFTAVADDALGRPDGLSGEPTQQATTASIEAWTAHTAQQQMIPPSTPVSFAAQQQQQQPHELDVNEAQRSLDGLTDDQRQQLLTFYMDSSHRFGPNNDRQRHQLQSYAPGLFDVETAFWNEAAGSNMPVMPSSASTLSNAFGYPMPIQQQQPMRPDQDGRRPGGKQQHGGLAMLAALAPQASPQGADLNGGSDVGSDLGSMRPPMLPPQQQAMVMSNPYQQVLPSPPQRHNSGNVGQPYSQLQQQTDQSQYFPPQQHQHQLLQQQQHLGGAASSSPFAFNLDPGQRGWDPLMSTLDLGPGGFGLQQQQPQQQ